MIGSQYLNKSKPLKHTMFLIQMLFLMMFTQSTHAEFYEDRRCSCVCPGLDVGTNKSKAVKAFFQDNKVTPEECNCNDMVLPRIKNKFNGSVLTYCIQCDCMYETRNTTVIMIVVISLIVIIAVLFLYMAFLYLLQRIVKHLRPDTPQEAVGSEEQMMGLLNSDNNDDEL